MLEYKHLNILYKSETSYINSLEKKIQIILGEKWSITFESQTETESFGKFTCLVLHSPGSVKIHNRFQLAKFCKLKNLDFKKVQYITFKLFHLNKYTYTVDTKKSAMSAFQHFRISAFHTPPQTRFE